MKEIYSITNNYPEEEKYGLVSQLRRAALSIPTNLAEGSTRSTKKDQANFTTISYGSLMEVLNLLILSLDLGYINKDIYDDLRCQISMISNKLNALRKAQLKS